MSGKHYHDMENNNPGPNHYDPTCEQVFTRAPAFSISSKYINDLINNNPGPGAYN